METLLAGLINIGGPSAVLAVMVYFFNKQSDQHKQERDDWQKANERTNNEFVDALKDNTTALTKVNENINNGNVCNYRKAS